MAAPARRRRRPAGPLAPLLLKVLLPRAALGDDGNSPSDAPPPPRRPPPRRKRILSLGGNGMIGGAVLSKLIEADEEYDITLASRGNWPFDSAERIEPHVKFVRCDRSDRPDCGADDDDDDDDVDVDCDDNGWRHSCSELVRAVEEDTDSGARPYWAVLDFSGLNGDWISDAVEILPADRARVYVHASCQNVYEVCYDGGPWYYSARDGYIKNTEDAAARPARHEDRLQLAELDEKGHEKLRGEEALHWQRRDDATDVEGNRWEGVPYVSLRFGDVIGPRDTSERYATYHVWARYVGRVEGLPSFHVDNNVATASSVTYVEDAARAVLKVMETPESWDDAYNVASEDVFNVAALAPILGEILGRDPAVLGVTRLSPEEGLALYPSVTRGPVDVFKAKMKLGFEPTPLRTALEETAAWYDAMFLTDMEVRKSMVEEFVENVLYEDDEDYEKVVGALWDAIERDVREAEEASRERESHEREEL